MAEQLDQNVVAMMKALASHESGNRAVLPQEKGIGGASIYQYTTSTWKGVAEKYLGDANAPLNRANENKATYFRIKEWKDKGFKPAQIASMWNAGEGEPNAYTGKFSSGKPSVGVNNYGVKYDVPAHAKSVLTKFQAEVAKIPKVESAPIQPTVQTETAVQQPQEKGFLASVEDKFKQRGQNITEALVKSSEATKITDQNPLTTSLRFAGQTAGLIGDIGYEAARALVPDWAKKRAKQSVENFNKNLNPEAKKILDQKAEEGLAIAAQGAEKYDVWKKENPQTASILEDSLNIASLFPLSKGAQAVGTEGKVAVQEGKKFLAKTIEKKAATTAEKNASEVVDLISPYLTKKEKQAAIASGRGVSETAFKGSKILPSATEKQIAETVIGFVDPKKTNIENIKSVSDGIQAKANVLRNYLKDTNIPYEPKELVAEMRGMRQPFTLNPTQTKKAYNMAIDAFEEFANKNPKTLDGLLTARQQFDNWIEQNIPKVWEDGNYKPIRDALRNARLKANDYIAENAYHFSKDKKSPILQSLREQSMMYEAIDGISQKEAKALGQSKLKRGIEKRPLLKKALPYVVGAGLGKTLLD